MLGRAIDKQPGRIAYSANGEDALPFEVVAFQVLNGLKGKNGDGVVYVERAGGVDPEGNPVHLNADGGDFELGNTYLLFLKRQEDGGALLLSSQRPGSVSSRGRKVERRR